MWRRRAWLRPCCRRFEDGISVSLVLVALLIPALVVVIVAVAAWAAFRLLRRRRRRRKTQLRETPG
jgi:Flp pilus assembly protein TadB